MSKILVCFFRKYSQDLALLEAHQPADEEAEDEEDDDTAAGETGIVHQLVNQIENTEGHNRDDDDFHKEREDDVERAVRR